MRTIYECLGLAIADKAGVDPQYLHDDEDEVVAFQPWPGVSRATYVNVDATNRAGLDRARDMGLVPSGLVDLVVTGDVPYAVRELFDESHKGRVVSLDSSTSISFLAGIFILTSTWSLFP